MDDMTQGATGSTLVGHWDWAANRGLMKKSTARSTKASVKRVISIDPNWERLRVADMDVEDILARFRSATDINPASLRVYESRFRNGLASYMSYLQSPSTYRPLQRSSKPRGSSTTGRRRSGGRQATRAGADLPAGTDEGSARQAHRRVPSSLVTYPFPIRAEILAELSLPVDLSAEEADRVATFVKALVMTKSSGSAKRDHDKQAG